MSGARDEFFVDLDAAELGPLRRVGTLRRARARGILDVSFAYDPAWSASARSFDIDPELGRFEGDQRPERGVLHGVFADTAPDRWGRMLLTRREVYAARREKRSPRTLDEWDYLGGVLDDLRLGALRLRRGDRYVAESPGQGVPPMTRLRELQHYAARAEAGEEVSLSEAAKELSLLLAPGSSLGGARPKANFRHADGTLWIAKFPSREDMRDVGAWEYVLHLLADAAGIPVPECELLRLKGKRRTFCARRFDRDGRGRRLFASAMTLAQKRDGEDASYLDIAQAVESHGEPRAIAAELEQLFRRAAFALLSGHRDDHLRNHGFLRAARGWRLSPAFDLNPLPEKPEHVLAFDEADRTPSLGTLRATADYYRLKPARADKIIAEVRAALGSWETVARRAGLPRSEIELMRVAFSA